LKDAVTIWSRGRTRGRKGGGAENDQTFLIHRASWALKVSNGRKPAGGKKKNEERKGGGL